MAPLGGKRNGIQSLFEWCAPTLSECTGSTDYLGTATGGGAIIIISSAHIQVTWYTARADKSKYNQYSS